MKGRSECLPIIQKLVFFSKQIHDNFEKYKFVDNKYFAWP